MAKKLTQEEVLERFKKVHGNKYNYSKVNYKGTFKKVEIICSKHGSFFQNPSDHWKNCGCPKCSKNRNKSRAETIIDFKKVHGDRYDYSKVKYSTSMVKVEIICSKHGSFFQKPNDHKKGTGCPKCGGNFKKTDSEVIQKFKKIHGNLYNYDKVKYFGKDKKVEIICPKHGSFWQVSSSHWSGIGCPICKSSKGEKAIRKFLEENNINFTQEYKFNDCKNILPLPFDFYLPDLNTIIEYDGEQHFKAYRYFGGKEAFEKTKKRDFIKNKYCENNNINLIRLSYKEINNIKTILKEKLC